MRPAQPGEDDPVARAEQALAAISGDFSDWMLDECARLDAARRKVREIGLSKETRQELFLAAHDVKGDSGTLGYPEVVPALINGGIAAGHLGEPLVSTNLQNGTIRVLARQDEMRAVDQVALLYFSEKFRAGFLWRKFSRAVRSHDCWQQQMAYAMLKIWAHWCAIVPGLAHTD